MEEERRAGLNLRKYFFAVVALAMALSFAGFAQASFVLKNAAEFNT